MACKTTSPDCWQVLDVGSIWVKEFAAALNKFTSVIAWEPTIRSLGHWEHWQTEEELQNPPLVISHFPLQRGYARKLLSRLLPYERKLVNRLQFANKKRASDHLICTTPFYAPLAEIWEGPVIYYATDLTKTYEGCNERQVVELETRLCERAELICPNSTRIARYLIDECRCNPAKIQVIANATRLNNISAYPIHTPLPLPAGIANLKRPIAGVIGNLAGNMDWLLLEETILNSGDTSWLFVGPTAMPIRDVAQANARQRVMKQGTFTGPVSYGELQTYARSFDVAVLPYRKHEPTYSGSSTRYYEHLAACRPMLGTRGFAELIEKQPLIHLVDTASEMIESLLRLRRQGFRDGYETDRWLASRVGTWERRAQSMIEASNLVRSGKQLNSPQYVQPSLSL